MRASGLVVSVVGAVIAVSVSGLGQRSTEASAQGTTASAADPVKALVGRLDLEKFKATIKGLTQFGDRRQGTDRNLAAVNWIEAQLRGFGCATERAKYVYTPAPPASPTAPQNRGAAPGRVIASGEIRAGQGGSRYRGVTRPTSVNTNPDAQPDLELRRLNEPADGTGSARTGVLHQGRHDAPRRDVHRRRAYGWTRLGRGRQRQRIRAPRSSWSSRGSSRVRMCRLNDRFDSRCGTTRRRVTTAPSLTSSSERPCRAGRIRRDRAGIRSPGGSA